MSEACSPREPGAVVTLRRHWRHYALEAVETAVLMIAVCAAATLAHHPDSPIAGSIESPTLRRALQGAMVAATLIALIYSPLGARSGAHMNPAVTFTYWRLGRISTVDTALYITAHFAGAVAGFALASAVVERSLGDEPLRFLTTMPGATGATVAWFAELALAFALMLIVLFVNNHPRLTRYTGLVAAGVIMLFLTVEAPISGMSVNPARSLGAALAARDTSSLWIYFTAPPLGMVLASFAYVALVPRARVYCARINHDEKYACVFRCHFPELMALRDKP